MLDNFLDILTFRGAGPQTVDTRSTFGIALKSLGVTVQTSYVDVVGAKLSVHETGKFFHWTGKKIDEKVNVFLKRSVPIFFVLVDYFA